MGNIYERHFFLELREYGAPGFTILTHRKKKLRSKEEGLTIMNQKPTNLNQLFLRTSPHQCDHYSLTGQNPFITGFCRLQEHMVFLVSCRKCWKYTQEERIAQVKYCKEATLSDCGVWCKDRGVYVSVLNCERCLKKPLRAQVRAKKEPRTMLSYMKVKK